VSTCRVAVIIGFITYGDFRDNNVRGWATEFSGAACHDVVVSGAVLLIGAADI
jgi:hypothetical protein